jgi:glycosyltransferase involved in cell wall biosynthesis
MVFEPKKIHVLLVFDNLELSGADKVGINLLRHAQEFRSVDLRGVVCMDDRLGLREVAPMLLHLTDNMKNEGRLPFRLWKALVATVKLRSAAAGADLLIPVTPPAAILAKLATLFSPRSIVPWVHYDLEGVTRDRSANRRKFRDWVLELLYQRFVPSFEKLVFVSETSRASFVRRHRGRQRDGWVVLPNLLDERSFLPDSRSSTSDAAFELKKTGKLLLLFMGRLLRQKRWEDAIATAERLRERGFSFNMAFVGDGIECEQLISRIEGSPARASLHYLGRDSNPHTTLKLADGLIMTSLYEAWPTVILEAFAAGVPVFSYDCPSGPREMLGSGARGMLTDESPEHLAKAIVEYFAMRSERQDLMVQGARNFADKFRARTTIPAWEEALHTLAGNN